MLYSHTPLLSWLKFTCIVKPEWGIKFTIIEPGGFRTDWAGRSLDFGQQKKEIYDHLDAQKIMGARHGSQPGDPVKAAEQMLVVTQCCSPLFASDIHPISAGTN